MAANGASHIKFDLITIGFLSHHFFNIINFINKNFKGKRCIGLILRK